LLGVRGGGRTAERGPHAGSGEIRRRDQLDVDPRRLIGARQVNRGRRVGRDALEARRRRSKFPHRGVGPAHPLRAAIHGFRQVEDEQILVTAARRTQRAGQQAKRRGDAAKRQPERKDRADKKPRRASQGTKRRPQVEEHRIPFSKTRSVRVSAGKGQPVITTVRSWDRPLRFRFDGRRSGARASVILRVRYFMKLALTVAVALAMAGASLAADEKGRITGDYVEARTAEVFAGGCIMNSEAETMGRQAVMAWRITSGSFDGVALDGLTVAAVVAGDRNLGMREMGGEEPTAVKAIITIDPRATAAQRDALVRLVRELSGGLITDVVRVDVAPVRFATSQNYVEVTVPDSVVLTVNKEMTHDPSCGAMQWFKPFTKLAHAAMGVAEQHAFQGHGLNTKWSAPNKRSAFFGTFTY
jgi:hypothetical protein